MNSAVNYMKYSAENAASHVIYVPAITSQSHQKKYLLYKECNDSLKLDVLFLSLPLFSFPVFMHRVAAYKFTFGCLFALF